MTTDTIEITTAPEATRSPLADYSVERIYASVIDTMEDIGSNDSATFTDEALSDLFCFESDNEDRWHEVLIERIYPAGYEGVRNLDIRAPWVRKMLKRMWLETLEADNGAGPFGFESLETRVSLCVAVMLFEVFARASALRAD